MAKPCAGPRDTARATVSPFFIVAEGFFRSKMDLERVLSFLLPLLATVQAADRNIQKDDSIDSAFHDYDSHGCDSAVGDYYCGIKRRCVSTWESCEPLLGHNEQCTASWSGLSWDL